MENEKLLLATLTGLCIYRSYYKGLKKTMGTWFFDSMAEYLLKDIEAEIDKRLQLIEITNDGLRLSEYNMR